jgi:hypothetical protein
MDTHFFNELAMKWMRYAGLTLALLWAGFWSYFGLASGIGEKLTPVGVFLHTAMPGLIFLATAAIAWRWEQAGSILLLVEGMIVLIGYPIMFHSRFPRQTIIFVLLTMALPPLLAGWLLLLDWHKSKTPPLIHGQM